MTPDKLATLARAMGYEVEIDATGGYGVERVLLCEKATTTYEVGSGEPIVDYILKTVFRPHDDAAQAWEVLAWLDRVNECFTLGPGYVAANFQRVNHDKTAQGLRRAIVEAAVWVAEAAG